YVSMGGAPGFRSFLILCPARKTGVIVVHNSDIVNAETLAIDLLMLLHDPAYALPLPPVHLELGRRITERGLMEGLSWYEERRRDAPYENDYHPSFLVSLGYILLHRFHLPAEAIYVFKKGLEEDPLQWRAYNGMGEAYFRAGSKDEGVYSFQKSLDINPNNPVALSALGLTNA
ncbi:MAG: tetratricopeptide repeat protein, partial [Chitinophagaceae bacterium]